MILIIIIRWKVINWVLIWKELLFYLTTFSILLTRRLSSWTKMWVLGLHHSLLYRLCVPINCLFTSNKKVRVFLMGLYSRAMGQFHTEYGTTLLLDIPQFLSLIPYQNSSESVFLLLILLTQYDVSFVPNCGMAYWKIFQSLTLHCTHEV